jgi:hypothetical protein
MSEKNAKKNRNSSQMRNKALPLQGNMSEDTSLAPSLGVNAGATRDRQGKTKSKVMLGMPDVPIEKHLDTDAYVTKIGGLPVRIF